MIKIYIYSYKGDDGGKQQDFDQQIIKLFKHQFPQTLALLSWQF